jgi:hypothetical protein
MSTVVRTERVERFIEWGVELPAAVGEMSKAFAAAEMEAQSLGINTSYDDWCIVDHDDTHLILRIKVPAMWHAPGVPTPANGSATGGDVRIAGATDGLT